MGDCRRRVADVDVALPDAVYTSVRMLETHPKSATLCHFSGLVQIRRFWGNSTDDERALTVQGSRRGAPTTVLGAAEAGVAEQLQPMWVRLPCQELGRGLTLAVGAI